MSREVGVEPGGRRRRPYYRLSPWDNRTRGEGRAAASSMRHAQRGAGECQKMARTTKQDQVRELQRTLYRAAKADPARRFHARSTTRSHEGTSWSVRGSWRPLPACRVFIEKPGREELRPLSIPAVRDRIVQTAVKLVIEPVFEADFLPCSFGFRPKRSQHDALQVLIDQSWKGRRWVLESDVANCFEAIPHSGLMSAIEERVSDRHLLKLLRV